MPTYEYECSHCGYTFEAFQKITAAPLEECPKCHQKVKRLISSGAGIIFKGSGFYATDYRKTQKKDRDKPETKQQNTCPMAGECNSCTQKK